MACVSGTGREALVRPPLFVRDAHHVGSFTRISEGMRMGSLAMTEKEQLERRRISFWSDWWV